MNILLNGCIVTVMNMKWNAGQRVTTPYSALAEQYQHQSTGYIQAASIKSFQHTVAICQLKCPAVQAYGAS